MRDLTTFSFDGAVVRSLLDASGEPWFVAADVCAVLGIGNPSQAITRLDDEERTLISIQGASNGLPLNCVNESGLYSLILGSRKPEAKRFMHLTRERRRRLTRPVALGQASDKPPTSQRPSPPRSTRPRNAA